MPPDVDAVLVKLKESIKAITPEVSQFILFGSAVYSRAPRDIDVALIVMNGTNLVDFIRLVSAIVASCIIDFDIFVNCFPVPVSKFERPSSQFLSNIRANGREF